MVGENKGAGGVAARVLSRTRGVRDGEVYPVTLEPGTIIHGSLAIEGVRSGWAKLIDAPLEVKDPKLVKARESGSEVPGDVKNPSQTGAAKSSQSRPRGRAKGSATSKKSKAKRASS